MLYILFVYTAHCVAGARSQLRNNSHALWVVQNTFPDCQRTEGAAEDMPEGMTNDSMMCKVRILHYSARASRTLKRESV